jgi:phospholipid transport system substrate-binding protein
MGRTAGAVGALLLAFMSSAGAQDPGPGVLVQRIAREGIGPHVDFDEATRLAAGGAWTQASSGQRQRLVGEFRTMLIRLYANATRLYPAPSLKARASDDPGIARAQIQSGGQAVPVDFYLRNGKVYDINVDGVSLVRAYRSDFDAAVKQGGIDGLIARLREKNAAAK